MYAAKGWAVNIFIMLLSIFFCVLFLWDYLRPGVIPGDLHDGRITLYVLEKHWQSLRGSGDPLSTLFVPWKYSVLLSEPMWGSAPIYMLARAFGFDQYIALKFWFASGSWLNFLSAFFVLRRVGYDKLGSTFGAIIFAFSLPVVSQDSHAALLYRFCIPLGLSSHVIIPHATVIRKIALAYLFCAIQFAFGLYSGFFLLIAVTAYVLYLLAGRNLRAVLYEIKIRDLIALVGAAAFIVSMTLPSVIVLKLYGLGISAEEFHKLTPEIRDFLSATRSPVYSKIYSNSSSLFFWEKQLFVGVAPAICFGIGLIFWRQLSSIARFSFFLSFLFALLFISFGGRSLMGLIADYAGVISPRASSRFILIALFPLSIIGAEALRVLAQRKFSVFASAFLVMLGAWEAYDSSKDSVKISEVESRIVRREWEHLTDSASGGLAILYANTALVPQEAALREVDAMMRALQVGIPTFNGMSSFFPPGWGPMKTCIDVLDRLSFYNDFASRANWQKVTLSQLLMVGFPSCKNEQLRVLDFRELLSSGVLSYSQFFTQESWGRWQNAGNGKALNVLFWPLESNLLELRLRYRAVEVGGNELVLRVDNEVQILPLVIGTNVQAVPIKSPSGRPIAISLELKKTSNMKRMGINPLDDRELGLGLERIEIVATHDKMDGG